jgi:hypothetical protein
MDRAELLAELPFVARIADEELRAVVERVWTRLAGESRFARLAEAPWFTVTRDGEGGLGLMQHIRQVAALAEHMADTAEAEGAGPDRDLLRAGAALMDADKLVLSGPATEALAGIGTYTQHTFYGAHLAAAEGAPWPLVHCILSHSKNTGVRPQTVEAVILHYADYAVFDLRNIAQGRARLAAEDLPRWARPQR